MAASRSFWTSGKNCLPSAAGCGARYPLQGNIHKDCWKMLTVEDALHSLEGGLLPYPTVEDLAHVLRRSKKEREAMYGLRLHGYLCNVGLEGHGLLGNLLIQMLVEAGSMLDAQQVFDTLESRNEWSWTSLINGYVRYGKPENAFQLYEKMLSDSTIYPSGQTFMGLLKACLKLKDLERGQKLHVDIARRGLLEEDPFVGSILVDMYAKSGLIAKAQEVFQKLRVRDVVSWTTLIAGYTEAQQGKEALKLLEQMQGEGFVPDAVTFVYGLKASIAVGVVDKGEELHGEIERRGLVGKDPAIGNTLVDMYTKFGMLSQAQEVFDKLQVQDVVSWTALIAGYVQHSQEERALECFAKMQQLGLSANAVTFACILRACGNSKSIDQGEELHAMIEKQGPPLAKDTYIGSALVDMYSKFGFVSKARQVFNKLSSRTAVSWNLLITGYVENGQHEEALTCLELMKLEGIFADAVTFIGGLKACRSLGALSKGVQIHAELEIHNLSQTDAVVGSTLIDMYARCGLLAKAHEVFEKLPVREAASWTSLISGYTEVEQGDAAINCIEKMLHEGVVSDIATLICSLKACAMFGAMDKAQLIHSEIARCGIAKQDISVGNCLVSLYAKFGRLDVAREVVDSLSFRDVVTWTSLMTGYADHGQDAQALACFDEMQSQGFCASTVSYLCSLKACSGMGDTEKGYEIHTDIERRGLLESDPSVGNSLVNMYAKCGLVGLAKQVFERLSVRSEVSWATLIGGHVQLEQYEEAVNCYKRMQNDGISPDGFTSVGCLQACGFMGALDKGVDVHMDVERMGFIDSDPMVGTTVVDMYAKCGHLSKAHEVFNRLLLKDLASWTALMGGYVRLGLGSNVFLFFEQMLGEGFRPDPATFVILLSACSKIGLYKKSEVLFEAMSKNHGVSPVHEHYTCMVGGLARAGQCNEAITLIKRMPNNWHPEAWHVVLGACSSSQNLDLGKQAFEQVMGVDNTATAAYVYMSRIFAAAKDYDGAGWPKPP
ncbi:hypothetical protein GOP47_0030510 [Adiantum capillus-veneris]|nr:hypothetical protein GOP47_0030510 [Adiantum capillus-veneris]